MRLRIEQVPPPKTPRLINLIIQTHPLKSPLVDLLRQRPQPPVCETVCCLRYRMLTIRRRTGNSYQSGEANESRFYFSQVALLQNQQRQADILYSTRSDPVERFPKNPRNVAHRTLSATGPYGTASRFGYPDARKRSCRGAARVCERRCSIPGTRPIWSITWAARVILRTATHSTPLLPCFYQPRPESQPIYTFRRTLPGTEQTQNGHHHHSHCGATNPRETQEEGLP